jgi:hypothetical protein
MNKHNISPNKSHKNLNHIPVKWDGIIIPFGIPKRPKCYAEGLPKGKTEKKC